MGEVDTLSVGDALEVLPPTSKNVQPITECKVVRCDEVFDMTAEFLLKLSFRQLELVAVRCEFFSTLRPVLLCFIADDSAHAIDVCDYDWAEQLEVEPSLKVVKSIRVQDVMVCPDDIGIDIWLHGVRRL